MRLFVCEYLCGGWGGELVDSSLRAEGAAMLAAVAGDFCRVEGCRVVTLWDERLGRCPIEGADVILVRQADEATRLFRQYAAECDATFDIAPELEGVLSPFGLPVRIICVRARAKRSSSGTHLVSERFRFFPSPVALPMAAFAADLGTSRYFPTSHRNPTPSMVRAGRVPGASESAARARRLWSTTTMGAIGLGSIGPSSGSC